MSGLVWSLVWASAIFGVVALLACVGGYWHLIKRLKAISSELEVVKGQFAARAEALTGEVFDCRRRLAELDGRYTAVAEQPKVPASLHLNRRGQVLHLYRRGESPRKIAAALGMSQGEVKLIIKVVELGDCEDKQAFRPKNNLNRKRFTFLDTVSGAQKGEA
jgi:hypothetical protein